MIELEDGRVQRLAAERGGDRCERFRRAAVQRIAQQRPAVVRRVHPDLVG